MTLEEAHAILPTLPWGDYELSYGTLEHRTEWHWFYYEPGASEPHEGRGTFQEAVANLKRCADSDPGNKTV